MTDFDIQHDPAAQKLLDNIKTLEPKALERDYDYCGRLDADGQHLPEELPVLLKPIVDTTVEDYERLFRVIDALEAVGARQRDLLEAAVAGVLLGGALEEAHEARPRVLGEQGRLGLGRELVQAALEQRVDELLLVGEAAVDRADADARPAGDLVERDRQAVLGERRARGIEDALAVALRVTAQRAFGQARMKRGSNALPHRA